MPQNSSTSLTKQWQQRATQKLGHLFLPDPSSASALFLCSSDDHGVWRNAGRRGAQYAPQALLNCFKAMSLRPDQPNWSFSQKEISRQQLYSESFDDAQKEDAKKIAQSLEAKNFSGDWLFHLGGGHDHIYPLLMGLSQNIGAAGIGVINIDAHLDTRTDPLAHSGTPFRQFSQQYRGEFKLIQVGIHPYANAPSNYQQLGDQQRSEMLICSVQDIQTTIERVIKESPKQMSWILSLDCDGLHSSIMEAVSAVNHNGLSFEQLTQVGQLYLKLIKKRQQARAYVGLYEYNPVYDNLSQKGARTLCAFLYDLLESY